MVVFATKSAALRQHKTHTVPWPVVRFAIATKQPPMSRVYTSKCMMRKWGALGPLRVVPINVAKPNPSPKGELIDAEIGLCMVVRVYATLAVAAPALPKAISPYSSSVPCRDVTQVGPRGEIRLVATLMEDAVLDGGWRVVFAATR